MWRFSVLGLAACSFTHGTWQQQADDDVPVADAHVVPDVTPDAPPNFALRVSAYIDGRSQLIFKGTTVQWQHFQFAAPGREQGANMPTKLGDVDWQPVWPDVPTAENRDCNCKSNVYFGLPIGIPRVPSTAAITSVQTRKAPTIIESPTETNDYTLVVELSDLGFSGSSTNIVDIAVDVTP